MYRKELFERCASFSISQPLLKIYDTVVGLPLFHGADITIDDHTEFNHDDIVLFVNSYDIEHNLYAHIILARAFKLRGYEPLFVVPDTDIPCANIQSGEEYPRGMYEFRKYQIKKALDKFVIRWIDMLDYENNKYNDTKLQDEIDINFQSFAIASTRKALRRHHLSSEEHESVQQQFVQAGVRLAHIYNRIIDSYDITAVVTHDEKYNHGGIPIRIAENEGIPTYSTTLGWRDKSIVLSRTTDRNSFPHYEKRSLIEKFISKPLSNEQNQVVDKIMSDRITDDGRTTGQCSSQPRDPIQISESEAVVGMFTNLIWDASLEAENCPYPEVFNWIQDTIEYFQNQEVKKLIIKTHPAERVRGTNEPVGKWIRDNYTLASNITILDPDTSVNTYQLLTQIDASIVYNSTVGFESVYLDTPVITGGDTHYRNVGISCDPTTKVEYLELLENISELTVQESQRRRVRRYIYFLLEGKHHDFPYISNVGGEGGIKYNSTSDSEIRDAHSLTQIVNSVIENKPVLISELNWLLE